MAAWPIRPAAGADRSAARDLYGLEAVGSERGHWPDTVVRRALGHGAAQLPPG